MMGKERKRVENCGARELELGLGDSCNAWI
jgi:hypothetical protein